MKWSGKIWLALGVDSELNRNRRDSFSTALVEWTFACPETAGAGTTTGSGFRILLRYC